MSNDRSDLPEALRQKDLDEALRRWASRPPVTPAAEAARRIEACLAEDLSRSVGVRTGLRAVWRLTVAATLVLAVALGLILGRPGDDPGPEASPDSPPGIASPAPAHDVLVIDLDDRTTLYMNLARSGPEPGAPGEDRSPEGDRS